MHFELQVPKVDADLRLRTNDAWPLLRANSSCLPAMRLPIRRCIPKLRARPVIDSGTHRSASRYPRRRDNNFEGFETWPPSSIFERPAPIFKPISIPIPRPLGEGEIWRAESYKKVVEQFAAKRTEEGFLSTADEKLAWWFGAAERCLRDRILNVQEIDKIRKYATFGWQVDIEKVAPRHQPFIKILKEHAAEREEFDKRQVGPSDHARESPTREILETSETSVTKPEIPFRTFRTLEIPSDTLQVSSKTSEIPSVTEVDDASRIARVESIIHYRFRDQSLCFEALTSKLDKHNFATINNERLALLGEHALSMYVANLWWESGLPTYFGRSWDAQLAVVTSLGYNGILLGLDKFILGLNHEYKSPYRVTAEAVQAIIGAVYLDSDRGLNTMDKLMRTLGVEKQFSSKVAKVKSHVDLPHRYKNNKFESTRPLVKALHDDRSAIEPIVESSKPKPSAVSPITRDVPEGLKHQTAVSERVPAKSPHATRASTISELVPKLSHYELHYHKNWSTQRGVSIEAALEETLKRWRDAIKEIRKCDWELKKNPPPREVSAWKKIIRYSKTTLRSYEKQFPILFANYEELGLLPLEQLRKETGAQKSSTDSGSATGDLVDESQRYDEKGFESATIGGSESQHTSFSSAGTSSGPVDQPNVVPAPGSISETTTTSEHMLKDPQPTESERPLSDLGYLYSHPPHSSQIGLSPSDTIEPNVTVSGEADMLAKRADLRLTTQPGLDLKTGRGKGLENFEDRFITRPFVFRYCVENESKRTGKPKAEGMFSWENYWDAEKDGL